MSSTTVRLSDNAVKNLRELAAESGETMQAVLDKAIEEYRRKRFFEEADRAYAVLQSDPEAWAEELKFRAEWDATLMDGLDPEEVWTEEDWICQK